MNILFISNHPFPNGMAGTKRIRLFAEFMATKYDVKVLITGRSNGNNPSQGVVKNVQYQFVPTTRKQSISGYSRVRKLLKEAFVPGTLNVLFLYDGIGLTNRLYAIIGRKLGYTIVTDVVENYSLHEENTGFLLTMLHKINQYFDKRIHRYADGLIVISSVLKDKYLKLSFPSERMETIPVTAENIALETAPQTPVKDSTKFNFVYSGSYGKKDGVEDLIIAFNKIAPEFPEAQLKLSGKINEQIAQLIEGNPAISYCGMIPDSDYYDFLSSANVLLMTRVNSGYANAGFPFKLGEYLATGVPVIATRVSDIELYLEDNKDVIIAEPSNIESLTDKLRYAIENKDQLMSIGANGKTKCSRYFHPETNGSLLEKLIIKVANHD